MPALLQRRFGRGVLNEMSEIPAYHGFGFFGESLDPDKWPAGTELKEDLSELYPELADEFQNTY